MNNYIKDNLIIIIFTIIVTITVIFQIYIIRTYEPEFYRQQGKLLQIEKRKYELNNISKTLNIAHNLSDTESDIYALIFNYYSNKYNVSWEILSALVRIESNYNPTLKSNKDAIGLCQILESTAESYCDTLNIKYKKGQTLWNEFKNMEIGFYYLISNMDSLRSDSSIINSTKIYLGGPDYRKKLKFHRYIGNYSSSIYEEYQRLKYIYKGIKVKNR